VTALTPPARSTLSPYTTLFRSRLDTETVERFGQEVVGLLVGEFETLDPSGTVEVVGPPDQYAARDAVVGDVALEDVLIEEVVDLLVERVERERSHAGEVPFEAGVVLPSRRRADEWIARRGGQLGAIQPDGHEVTDVGVVRPGQHLRHRHTDDYVVGHAEPHVQARQPVTVVGLGNVLRSGGAGAVARPCLQFGIPRRT